MNVSAWSIRNPLPAVMVFVLLSLGGIVAFWQAKLQYFPDLDLPTVITAVSLPGASPAQMETDVARKIENAIASVQGLKHLYTLTSDGSALITAEFYLEKPVQEAVDDVRLAVARVRADLPGDVRDPVITRLNISGLPVLAFTVKSKHLDETELSWFIDDKIARRLLAIRGVGAVNRVGGRERQVQVLLDPLRLQALNATATEVSRQLRQMQQETPGGRIDAGGQEQIIRALGNVASTEEIKAIQLTLQGGRRIRLDQIATIQDTWAEPRSAARLDGVPVVGFEVARSRGESEVAVGRAVQNTIEQLRTEFPDLEINLAFDFVAPAEQEYIASMQLLLEGAVLAILMVWLFLGNWRATFVSGVALPLSLLPTFIGMSYLGFSINVVTLLALSLVVGILVDDAIVEVENIVRHLRMGKTPYQAAMEAADEIGLAVIATTFTLVAVFLPTAFMSGIPGKFFKQFGWTAAIAVMASLLVARMLTPMMAAYMMQPHTGKYEDPKWLLWYMRCASFCIRWRWMTLLSAIVFFWATLQLASHLPADFIPTDDNSQTLVHLQLTPGTPLASTLDTAEKARLLLMKVDHVKSIYTTIGGGSAGQDPFAPAGATGVRKAVLTIQLDERGYRPKKQKIEQAMRQALRSLPGIRYQVGFGGGGEKYVFALAGDDPVALQSTALALEKELRTKGVGGSITSSASLARPEWVVRPDYARAADLGVSTADMGETLRIATLGDYDFRLPKLNLAQRQIPIVVMLEPSARLDTELLSDLRLPGSRGTVPLREVASIEFSSGNAIINRFDRVRNINFDIELAGESLGDARQAVAESESIKNLASGIRLVEVGDAEAMPELFQSFAVAMLAGLICIYLVLVLLFQGFLQPITIMIVLSLTPL